MPDHETADRLQDSPAHAGHGRTRRQLPQRDLGRGKDVEGEKVQAEVYDGRGGAAGDWPGTIEPPCTAGTVAARNVLVASPRARTKRKDDAAGQALQVVGRSGPGRFQTCDMVKMPFWARPSEPHNKPTMAITRLMTLLRCRALIFFCRSVPIIGNWPKVESSTCFSRCGVAAEDEAENGHQQQKENEHRPKGGIGEVGHQSAGVVIAEFLDNPEKEGSGGVPLLEPVNGAEDPFEDVHRPPSGAGPTIAGAAAIGPAYLPSHQPFLPVCPERHASRAALDGAIISGHA